MAISLVFGRDSNEDSNDINVEAVQELVREFAQRNGAIGCTEIIGYNLSKPEEQERAKAAGVDKKCSDISGHAAGLTSAIIEKYQTKVG